MSFSKLLSMQLSAYEPQVVDVEVDISTGLNAFSIVGLPDKAIEEAKDRVSAAIKNCGLDSPKSKNQKVVISLAPAEMRKEGANFDLAMALAYLLSVDDIRFDPKEKMFLGELSLDGSVRKIKGVLPLVIAAKKLKIKELFLPYDNKEEASLIEGIAIYPVRHLKEIIEHLNTKIDSSTEAQPSTNLKIRIAPLEVTSVIRKERKIEVDIKEIKGQEGAKRALEIAASGGHNIMMYGPPGTGKTMLARAFSSLLPPLDFDAMLEVTTIHSTVKNLSGVISFPPFRSPHHSASFISLVGGGLYPKPGEITLAHRGVLFMDEFPEFESELIEALRQPLEDKCVVVARAKQSVVFPCDFILLGSMNPCPCGFKGSKSKECICSFTAVQRYQRKISGPIIDRIDIWAEVSEVDYKKLGSEENGEGSIYVQKRIEEVRVIQTKRFNSTLQLNASMNAKDINKYCPLTKKCRDLLDASAKNLHLSARSYHKLIKIARTIADMEGESDISEPHILEALQYRPKI